MRGADVRLRVTNSQKTATLTDLAKKRKGSEYFVIGWSTNKAEIVFFLLLQIAISVLCHKMQNFHQYWFKSFVTFCLGVYIYRCGEQKGGSPNLLLNQIWEEAVLTDIQHCSVDYAEDIHQTCSSAPRWHIFSTSNKKRKTFCLWSLCNLCFNLCLFSFQRMLWASIHF